MVKFSIVTAVYNGEKYIRETIDSVLKQSYGRFELIIIDGRSSDGTHAIVQSYKDERILYYSQADSGISEAFNRGLFLAAGEYVLFLNSDDKFFDKDVLRTMSDYIYENLESDLLYGRMYWMTTAGERLAPKESRFSKLWLTLPMSHGASFVRLSAARRFRYNIDYRIAMDVDFIMNFIGTASFISCDISLQREGGISSVNRLLGYYEFAKILHGRGYHLAILGLVIKVGIYVYKETSRRLSVFYR